MKPLFLVAAALIFCFPTEASGRYFTSDLKGTTGGVFFKLEGTARDIALGSGASAASSGADSVFSNPAGLSAKGGNMASASHSILFEDIYLSQFSVAVPFRNTVVGFYGSYLGMDEIDSYTGTGLKTGERYSPYFLSSGLYFSFKAGRKGHIGAGVKGFFQDIDGDTASSAAVDAGYLREEGNIRSGISIRNAGPPVKFSRKADPLPFELNTSIAWRTPFKGLLACGGVSFPSDNNPSFQAGLEYVRPCRNFNLKVRTGYNSAVADDHGVLSGFAAGGGIKFKNLVIDYSWLPWGTLDSSHRISVAFRPRLKESPPEREYIFGSEEKNSYIEYFYIKGVEYYDSGKFEEASDYFERVLKFDPGNVSSEGYLERIRHLKR